MLIGDLCFGVGCDSSSGVRVVFRRMGVAGSASQSSGLFGRMGLFGRPVDALLCDVVVVDSSWLVRGMVGVIMGLLVGVGLVCVSVLLGRGRGGSLSGVSIGVSIGVALAPCEAVLYLLLLISSMMASNCVSSRLVVDARVCIGDM